MSRPSDDNAPFSALAFKIMSDPFVGSLTFTRIYSGVLESGSNVYNSVKVWVSIISLTGALVENLAVERMHASMQFVIALFFTRSSGPPIFVFTCI